MTEFTPEQATRNPWPFQPGNILDLPTELLLRVISFLPTAAIRNLMVNRLLRSVCEQALYQNISILKSPRRSIRLLETFLLRPDLALLVRRLGIDFGWWYPKTSPPSQVQPTVQPDGLAALSLARNIHSLTLSGVGDWIWAPYMVPLREVIFQLRLLHLGIPFLSDPHTEYACVFPPSDWLEETWDGDLGHEIQKLLQAQPLLEELNLPSTISSKTVASLQANLQASDVPSLKSLQAPPDLAVVFLPLAPQLESLNLTLDDWGDRLFSKMEANSAATRSSVRRFTIRVWDSDEDSWFWSNLANVFALFPNTEELSVSSLTSAEDVEPAKYYFEKIANNVHVMPSLRSVEVRYETFDRETPGIFEVDKESIMDLKTSCPLLETVVDPEKRLWTFRPDRESSGSFVPHFVGRFVITEGPVPMNDLSVPKEI